MVFSPRLFGKRLNEVLKLRGMTQSDLAKHLEISQPTVSKMVAGKTKRFEGHTVLVCNYFGIEQNDCSESAAPETSSALQQALAEVWDGTKEGEAALAAVIRSLKPLASRRVGVDGHERELRGRGTRSRPPI